jgi:hypothetical protein
MKRPLLLLLALTLAPAPVFAQVTPPSADAGSIATPSPQARALMQQSRAQLAQIRQTVRVRMLAALTPAHRTMLANAVGNLVLAVNPDPRAVAAQLDAVLAPAEKQAIIAIDAAGRTSSRAIMQQQRAAFESTLSADQKARIAARQAQMAAYRQSHPRPTRVPDAGMIALRTLGAVGRERMGEFGPPGPPPGPPGA